MKKTFMERVASFIVDRRYLFIVLFIAMSIFAIFTANSVHVDEDLTDWFHCIDIDLNGAMRMSYIVGKYMRDAGKGGKVINITSNSGAIINKPVTFAPYHAATR